MAPGSEVIQAMFDELEKPYHKTKKRIMLPVKPIPVPPRLIRDSTQLPPTTTCFYCDTFRSNSKPCPQCGGPSDRNKNVI